MMSEEEKELIEDIQQSVDIVFDYELHFEDAKILLNLIKKQQKELEQEKEKNKKLEEGLERSADNERKLTRENTNLKYKLHNSISKDKIIKLKELVHKTLDDNGITRAFQLVIDDYFDSVLKGD